MKIIIVGCGKVGSTLAEELCEEDHELIVIDRNPQKIQQLSESLDVMGLCGNGSVYRKLSQRCSLRTKKSILRRSRRRDTRWP